MYGREPRLFRAPGRVNLIGDHTDYNEGFVLPMALDRETVVAGAARADFTVRVHSLDLNVAAEFDLKEPGEKRRGSWLDYVEGIARVLQERGASVRGADLMLHSDVPIGAGLSSSAALEISVGLALLSLSGQSFERTALALAAQRTEHEYVGINSGIMDQLISALGRRGHALLIDCRSLETKQIPLETQDVAIVICDTRVKHELASSAYNTRRAECERAVELLRAYVPGLRSLRDLTAIDFFRYERFLPDVIQRRCRHVVTENGRTLTAAAALEDGNFDLMGRAMYFSHESLRDDYEVSCPELDLLVEIAASVPGTLGARMTGGGFGGCTVNLVRRASLAEFQTIIPRKFSAAFSYEPALYPAEPGDGAEEI
ncbi:MAG: galactokinase [Acidobacteria bacterium]|nr:galactokinase [Acidobacteriota bacterium]